MAVIPSDYWAAYWFSDWRNSYRTINTIYNRSLWWVELLANKNGLTWWGKKIWTFFWFSNLMSYESLLLKILTVIYKSQVPLTKMWFIWIWKLAHTYNCIQKKQKVTVFEIEFANLKMKINSTPTDVVENSQLYKGQKKSSIKNC